MENSNKIESEPQFTLQKLAEDCQRCISIKKVSKSLVSLTYEKYNDKHIFQPFSFIW